MFTGFGDMRNLQNENYSGDLEKLIFMKKCKLKQENSHKQLVIQDSIQKYQGKGEILYKKTGQEIQKILVLSHMS